MSDYDAEILAWAKMTSAERRPVASANLLASLKQCVNQFTTDYNGDLAAPDMWHAIMRALTDVRRQYVRDTNDVRADEFFFTT